MSPKRKGSQKRASASKQQGDGSVPSLAGGSRVSVSSVQISSGNEARIKDLLQALQPQMGSALDSDLGENTKPASVQQLSVVYDELLHHGFTEEQAQNALRSIPKASIQLEAALEWLLLNIPPEQLPARFTGAQRLRAPAAGGIRKVVEAASSSPAAGREADGAAAAQEDAAARDAAAEAVAQLRPAAELRQLQQQQEAAQQQQAAEDKAALKSYIMAQHNRDSGSQAGSEASSDDLADYDPWATPEEKQRRRQERAKAKIPPEVRRAQIAVEWADAKDAAAAAKAARNKAKQQECGKRIRDLKQEMEALGLSEAMLQELLSPLAQQRPQPGADAEVPAAPSVGPGEASTPETQPLPAEHDEPSSAAVLGPTSAWEWSTGAPPAGAVREDAPGGSSTIQEPGAGPGGEEGSCASGHGGAGGQEAAPVTEVEAAAEGKLGEAAVDLQQQQRQHEEEEEEEGFEVPSLFDEDQSSDLTADAGQSRARREADLDLLTPWGYNAPRPNRSGRKPAAPAPPEQLPKALLQQYCQRMSLPGPRYSRVSKPGEPAVRYSVTVTFPPAKGRHRFARHSGPRTFGLLESEDGWQSIQDAQNAAATRALFEVADNAPLYLMLSQPFRDLWIRWEDSLDGDRQEAAEQRRASKQQFLDSLMQEAQPARTAPEKCADRLASSSAANDTSDDNRDDIPRPRVVLNAEPARTREGSSLQMKEALMAWRSSDTGQSWMEKRNALPVAAITDQLAAALQRCDAVLVSGDTGCGKTTQIPQFILDDAVLQGHGSACHVICTQPRRIAAVSVARRVAEERGEGRPGGPGCVTGYHVRMDAAVSAATRLLFCTTGILLRRMASDPQLDEVSHVVVDEVHERSVQSDFLLALLRDLLPLRRAQGRPLKVVMMSATVDPVLYTSYFNQFQVEALHTQGRTFPVEQHFLEDVYEMVEYTLGPDASMRSGRGPSTTRKAVLGQAGAKARALLQAGWGNEEADAEPLNPHYDPELYPPERYCARTRSNLARLDERATDLDLVEELVAHIDKHHDPGAVLVFLPGMAEISAMVDRLDSHPQFGRAQPPSHVIVALHSTVSTASQLAAFRKPPQGVRKIVLATNIAETSLTIDDVVYVVDAGKVKERWHNHARGMSLLVESLVSQAAAKQRRGRAGRSRPGVAYALFTRDCFVRRMAVRPVPEILRVPLEETVLTVHLLGLAPAGPMLSRMLQPPPDKAAAAAVARLQEVGALSTQEALTPLGRHLALLPVDVHIGKMLVLSACLGCLSPALSIAACLSHKPPFLSSLDDNDRSDRARRALAAPLAGGDAAAAQLSARMLAAGQQSDHLLMAAALQLWLSSGSRSAARRVAQQHCLAEPAIKMLADLRLQLGGMLADAGLVRREDARREGEGWEGGAWVDAPWLPANRHSDKPAVVKAALTAALYPKVAVMQAGVAATRRPEWHDSSGTVHVHPTAVVHPLTAAQFRARFLVFQEKMKTSKVFVKDCTVVSPLALLLLGGRELDIHHEAGYIEMDGWIRISADAATAVLVKKLRASLEQVLEKAVRSRGGQGRERTVEQQQLMDTLVGMLVEDDAKSEAA